MKASASFIGILLAAVLLGPAPALVIALTTMLVHAVQRRPPIPHVVYNLAAYATFAVCAALLMRGVEAAGVVQGEVGVAVAVFAIFLVTNVLNFLLVAVDVRVSGGAPIGRSLREVYVPCLPVATVSALLTGTLAYSYVRLGLGVVLLLAAVVVSFQYLCISRSPRCGAARRSPRARASSPRCRSGC